MTFKSRRDHLRTFSETWAVGLGFRYVSVLTQTLPMSFDREVHTTTTPLSLGLGPVAVVATAK